MLTKHQDYRTIPAKLHPGNAWAQKIVPATRWPSASPASGRRRAAAGASVGANYQSTTVHLPPALATGNLDIIPNAHCREVIARQGRQGHRRRSSSTRRPARRRACSGKAVILAAGACETVRILLNSHAANGSTAWPTPAAWSASTSWTPSAPRCTGHVPALENLPPHNEDGAGGDHFYSPWWLYKEQKAGKLDFGKTNRQRAPATT